MLQETEAETSRAKEAHRSDDADYPALRLRHLARRAWLDHKGDKAKAAAWLVHQIEGDDELIAESIQQHALAAINNQVPRDNKLILTAIRNHDGPDGVVAQAGRDGHSFDENHEAAAIPSNPVGGGQGKDENHDRRATADWKIPETQGLGMAALMRNRLNVYGYKLLIGQVPLGRATLPDVAADRDFRNRRLARDDSHIRLDNWLIALLRKAPDGTTVPQVCSEAELETKFKIYGIVQ